jgi:hypothetical protein
MEPLQNWCLANLFFIHENVSLQPTEIIELGTLFWNAQYAKIVGLLTQKLTS